MNLRERTGPDDGLLGGPRESDLIKRVAVDGPEVKPSGSRYSKWVQLVHNQGHQQNQEEISIRTRTRNKPPSEPEETSIRTREKVNQNQNQDRMIWGTEIRLIQGRFCSWIQSSSGCFLFQVLVTVPLTLLQRGLLHFHPPLPERKLKAIHSLGAGIIEKIALQFPTRFWDSKIQGADYFGHIPPAPEKRGLFSVFYDLDPQGKQAVLMSVISGDVVPAVCELEDQEVVGECLKVLRELFPEQDVPDPVNYFVTHWSKDRWSQMSYSFVKTGGSGEAYDVLAEDVQGKLFFAGEERTGPDDGLLGGPRESDLIKRVAVDGPEGHQPTLPSDRDGGLPQRGPRGQQNGCCVSQRPGSPWTPAPPDGWPTRPAWS
ncbi:uncharacterized protein ACNS7B_017976 isoform 2-T2 [Menidia menidia]